MKQNALRFFALFIAGCGASPALAVDLSGEMGIVSDYRYRGISLSDGKPAAQASIILEHESGAYASIWSSTIKEPDFDANVEIDLTAGYAFDLAGNLGLDLSATYYVYPSEPGSNYVEATAMVECSQGPVTLSAGFSFVPGQHATRDEQGRKRPNSYLFVGTSYTLPKFPLTLIAQLGRERGIFDEAEHGGKWDWLLGSSLAFDQFRVGLAYSGTDSGSDGVVASFFLDL